MSHRNVPAAKFSPTEQVWNPASLDASSQIWSAVAPDFGMTEHYSERGGIL